MGDSFDSKPPPNASESSENEAAVNNRISFSFEVHFKKIVFQTEVKSPTSHIEDQIMKLSSELRKLQENGDKEKQRNSQLEIQVKELKDKITTRSVPDIQPTNNDEVEALKQKLKQLEGQLEEVEGIHNKKISELKKEQGRSALKVENYHGNLSI